MLFITFTATALDRSCSMSRYDLNNREVEIGDKHFEPGEGVSIIHAVYVDNGQDLSDQDLYDLENKYQSELYENAYADAASNAYDRYKDRMKYGDE